MSLVGPRPHALGSTAEGALFWEAVPDYWTRHAMRPGITGLAQVRGLRGATLTRNDIEKRVAADLEYINSWSVWLDLKILIQTIGVVLHRNAFSFNFSPFDAFATGAAKVKLTGIFLEGYSDTALVNRDAELRLEKNLVSTQWASERPGRAARKIVPSTLGNQADCHNPPLLRVS